MSARTQRLGAWSVATVLVGVPVLLCSALGAFVIPRDDDWAYMRTVQDLARGHGLDLLAWPSATFVGQIALSAPAFLFGASTTALRAVVVVLGVVALGAASWSAREVGIGRRGQLTLMLLVATSTPFVLELPTYMTDVPGLAMSLLSLAAGFAAFGEEPRRAQRGLWLCVAMALVAFSIREVAAVIPFAVCLDVAAVHPERRRACLTALSAFLGGAGAIYLWRMGLDGYAQHPQLRSPSATLLLFLRTIGSLGLLLVPVTVPRAAAAWGSAAPRARWRAATFGGLFVALFSVLGGGFDVILDNSVVRSGVEGWGATGREDLVPAWAAFSLKALAVVSLSVMVLRAGGSPSRGPVRVRRTRRGPLDRRQATADVLRAIVLVQIMLVFVRAGLGNPALDRYLLFPAVCVALLVLLDMPQCSGWSIGVPMSLAGAIALLALWDASTFSVARWHGGQRLEAAGVPASLIEGGMEWDGWHHPGRAYERRGHGTFAAPVPPWASVVPGNGNCAAVSTRGVPPGWRSVGRIRYTRWPGARTGYMTLLRRRCVATGTSALGAGG